MLSLDPKEIAVARLFGHLTAAVSPRPIAFASTTEEQIISKSNNE